MSLPAFLKPESGPLGRALGAWLDHAPSGRATRFFLLWFVILYTAFAIISSASVGLHPDSLEAYVWGLHPSAGYDKHPPLTGLMAAAWFSLFPPTDWAFHLLAMANAAVGLYATDRIARSYLDGDKRIAVLLLLLLTPFYQFFADHFGANQTLLSTWPIAIYCFLRAFETRSSVGACLRPNSAANSSPPPIEVGSTRLRSLNSLTETRVDAVSAGEGLGVARGGMALPQPPDPPPQPSP